MEGFDDAAEEAEVSARAVPEESGLDKPLNKAALAGLMIEGKGHVKQPMQVNHEMIRPGEQMKGELESLKAKRSLQMYCQRSRRETKKHSEEQKALKEKLIEVETRIRQLIFEKDELSKKNHDLRGQVNALESDKSSLHRLVSHTKGLNKTLKTKHSEEESLCHQLAEENEYIGVIETKTLSLWKQIAELQFLEERLQKSTAPMNYLKRLLLNTKPTTSKLNREKESLKDELDKAGREASALCICFAQLLKDVQEM
ncbi:hypothetical protein HOY82DRAFT_538994 [Tuber indicum]|nr:hypothetical protein HOY82DRAFT_538994 [Tuber indicum]